MSEFLYSYEKMTEELEELERNYPGKIIRTAAGKSADNRTIQAVRLGKEGARLHLLAQGGMHGREYLNSALLMAQIRGYLSGEERCGPDSADGWFYENVCIHVFPMINPDGAAICQNGPESIRNKELRAFVDGCFLRHRRDLQKHNPPGHLSGGINPLSGSQAPPDPETPDTAASARKLSARNLRKEFFSQWKANARGVDLNRNFDAGWEDYCGEKEPSPCGYKGASPGSEPETRALLEFCENHKIDACLSYHSAGRIIYWDYGSRGRLFCREEKLARALAETTGYELCSTAEDRTVRAGFSDYIICKKKIPAVTIETGRGPCPLNEEEFSHILSENQKVWQTAARSLLSAWPLRTGNQLPG